MRDGNDQHLFYFLTQVTGGYLYFNYVIAGSQQYAYLPQGTEETQFGNGSNSEGEDDVGWEREQVVLQRHAGQIRTLHESAGQVDTRFGFELGAYEYLTYGGYNTLDDVIDEFTVTGTASSPAVLTSSASMAPRNVAEASRPIITRLQNGANETAPAACSPDAVASLAGHFLSVGAEPLRTVPAGLYRLAKWAYSSTVPTYRCCTHHPIGSTSFAPQFPFNLSVNCSGKRRRSLEPRGNQCRGSKSGIFAPVVLAAGADRTVSIRVTGMNWLAKYPMVQPYVRIGTQYVPIKSMTPDPQDSASPYSP